MSKGKGYLIPNNPKPDGLECLLVFYPDDIIYKYALVGSLQFLTTWVAWEKDGTTRAKEASEAWKEAYEETLKAMGCLESVGAGLSDIARALEGSRGGSCCCAPGTETVGVKPPWWDDGDDGNPGTDPIEEPPGWDSVLHGDYASYKCKQANIITQDWLATLDKILAIEGLLTSWSPLDIIGMVTTTFVSQLFVGVMAFGLSLVGTIVSLIGAFVTAMLVGSGVFALFQALRDNFDTQGAICALYDATSDIMAMDAFRAHIDASLATIPASTSKDAFAVLLNTIENFVLPVDLFRVLFNYREFEEPAILYDCQCLSFPTPGTYELDLHFDGGEAIPDLQIIEFATTNHDVNGISGSDLILYKHPEAYPAGAIRLRVLIEKFWEAIGYLPPASTVITGARMEITLRMENDLGQSPNPGNPFVVQQLYYVDGTRFDSGINYSQDKYTTQQTLVNNVTVSGSKAMEAFEWRYNIQTQNTYETYGSTWYIDRLFMRITIA